MSLSLLHKKWEYCTVDPQLLEKFQTETGLSPVLAQVLLSRNIDSQAKANTFFNATLDNLSDLELIPNIDVAARFILQAIEKKRHITIYGDYDVDGVTGTTLLVTAFRQLGAGDLDYYVPHRFTEGYGLNKEALKMLKARGTELIVTVDCGISNYEEIKYAKEIGLDVVVTDHHMPPVVLPEADFLINPKINNQLFASRNISGVAVAFKLVAKLFNLRGFPGYTKVQEYLDLVVLGTIADIVPLLEENRVLTILGLQQINRKARTGIRALAEVSGLGENPLTVKDIGFGLAPRINAAGRMDRATLAVQLLLETNYGKAKIIAEELNRLNNQRQDIGKQIKDKVVAEIERLDNKEQEKVFILASTGWHPGIIGIVASQIVKMYNRPTALIAVNGTEGRGSIRSVNDLDIFDPLSRCAYLLKDFGGHREAAGFEIEESRILEFKEKFTRVIEESIGFENLVPSLKIDMELETKDLTLALVRELERLNPCGQSNPQPVFSTKALAIYDFKRIGDGSHLKLSLTDGVNAYDGIGFGLGDLYDTLRQAKGAVEIAFVLSVNTWQRRDQLQLIVKDIRFN